ncbi:MAG: YbaK/EbsC family protein [Candidatus Omnitrophica bacterium]|nr:YbaK/EbsC family protein [Candidatus Omnitrophota bacterium]
MGLPTRLTKFLKKHKVYYQVQVHPQTFTASETAQAEHISGRKLAKVVMVNAEGRDVMVVLPSNRVVDLFKLSTALGTQDVRVESEKEFKDLFPDCEAGAMPPIGKIYGMPCYADKSLSEEKELYFNAGNHLETIEVSTADFLRVSKAVMGNYSVIAKEKAV